MNHSLAPAPLVSCSLSLPSSVLRFSWDLLLQFTPLCNRPGLCAAFNPHYALTLVLLCQVVLHINCFVASAHPSLLLPSALLSNHLQTSPPFLCGSSNFEFCLLTVLGENGNVLQIPFQRLLRDSIKHEDQKLSHVYCCLYCERRFSRKELIKHWTKDHRLFLPQPEECEEDRTSRQGY